MTHAEIGAAFVALNEAIASNDEKAGLTATLLIARVVVADLHRIADALEQIAHNLPAK